MPPAHIFLATPCFGGLVTHVFAASVLRLQAACREADIGFSFRFLAGDALVQRARNHLVEQFLAAAPATHLLFVDADIGFEADQVFRLLAYDQDIVGAAYPLKGLNSRQMALMLDQGRPIEAGFDYVVGFAQPKAIEPINGFARAVYLGTGFMLIRRSVFGRIAVHYPEIAYRHLHSAQNFASPAGLRFAYFDCEIDRATGHYLSEDFTFCKRWIDSGGTIWVDLASRLTHIGATEFRGDLAAKLLPAPAAP